MILSIIYTERTYAKSSVHIDMVTGSVMSTIHSLLKFKTAIMEIRRHDHLLGLLEEINDIISILLFTILTKNICKHKKTTLIEIKLLSSSVGYRTSYNIIRENMDDKNHKYSPLALTTEHVYDLFSISYGKKYKLKKNIYKRINIGLSLNFPGEFYNDCFGGIIPPMNVKALRLTIEINRTVESNNIASLKNRAMYKYTLYKPKESGDGFIRNPYYVEVCKLTTKKQWAVNILIGLIENIFIEYVVEMPICHFLVLYPLHIHISIGTILGTIEWLYRYFKEKDGRGFVGYFYTLFCMQSLCELKIGYYE